MTQSVDRNLGRRGLVRGREGRVDFSPIGGSRQGDRGHHGRVRADHGNDYAALDDHVEVGHVRQQDVYPALDDHVEVRRVRQQPRGAVLGRDSWGEGAANLGSMFPGPTDSPGRRYLKLSLARTKRALADARSNGSLRDLTVKQLNDLVIRNKNLKTELALSNFVLTRLKVIMLRMGAEVLLI